MMIIEQVLQRAQGLVSEKTQRGVAGLDLTLKGVFRLQAGGALDFGGSEYAAAATEVLPPKKGAEDKYGWWRLNAGLYRLELNESLTLAEGELALVSPHPRLLAAGGSHPSAFFGAGEELFALLQVAEGGLSLKQNCRVSRLAIFFPE